MRTTQKISVLMLEFTKPSFRSYLFIRRHPRDPDSALTHAGSISLIRRIVPDSTPAATLAAGPNRRAHTIAVPSVRIGQLRRSQKGMRACWKRFLSFWEPLLVG